MNGPERIWAWPFMPEKQNEDMQGGWTDKPDRREAQYVRADLFAAEKARADKAEAERDKLQGDYDAAEELNDKLEAALQRTEENRNAAMQDAQEESARAERAEALLAEAESPAERYVVWSNQHRAWWRPKSCGYTANVTAAGVYSREDAISISHKGRDGWTEDDRMPPDELPVRVTDLPEWAQRALTPPEAKP